jgi:glycosyltransferase 2 family protein
MKVTPFLLKNFRTILFVLVLIAIGWFVRSTDWIQVGNALQLVGWNFIWLLVATFLAALCGAVGWRYCLGESGKKVPLLDLFLIRHIGEVVGLINPTGMLGGEALKAAMLREKSVDRSVVVTSVVVSRVLTIVTQLILFVVVVALLYYEAVWTNIVHYAGWIFIFAVFIGIIGALARSGRVVFPFAVFRYIFERLPQNWQRSMLMLRESMHNAVVKQRAALGWASVYLTLHWLFGGLEFYLILRFLGTDASILQAIYVDMGVVFFKVAGTAVPGQIGVEEYGNKVMLEAIGLTGPEIWVTASILRRARQLFWIGFGLLTYFVYYHKWRVAPSPE